MARFTDLSAVIDHVKGGVDILKLITEDTGHKPQGNGGENNFIFCPLHHEKNKASFNINVRMQMYRCFGGCQDGGDAIKWVQTWHNLSAPEAVTYLADRFSIDISPFIRPATKEEEIRDRFQSIFDAAVEWCHTQFVNHPSIYQWYKTDTGFTDEQIAQYKIGYCPSTTMMVSFLFKAINGVSQHEIKKLELDNGTQFDDALVYPVYDLSGKASRIYSKPLNPPPTASYKYLGTSNAHPLFRKDLVYGLYQVRKSIRTAGNRVILCEGFKACIAAGGVAVMGTAISDEQLATLRAIGAKSIITCFDGDQPGYIASTKVVEELYRFRGLMVKIAQLPLDTQCDGLVKSQGKSALDAVLANAKLPIEFLVSTRYDMSGALSLEAKYNLLADVAPIVSKMNDAEIDITAGYLSGVLGVTDEGIRSYIRDIRAVNSKLVNHKAEEAVLRYTILEPTNWAKLKSSLFTPDHFSMSDHAKIFAALEKSYLAHSTGITSRLIKDQVHVLYHQDAERLSARLDNITTSDPEYSFDAAATITLDLWRRRTTIKQSEELKSVMQDLAQTPMQALHKFRRAAISSLEVTDNQACEPLKVADKVDRLIHERMALDGKVLGFDFSASGMPVLNSLLSGIQKGHYYAIAANQGVGKSAFALNIVNPIAIDQRVPTLWIPQEMPEEDLVMRLLSIRTGINNNIIQSGKFKDHDQYLLYCKARDEFAKGNLFFRRPVSGDIDEVYAIIEEYKFKFGIEVVVWDYIQLVGPTRDQMGQSKEAIVSFASNVITQRVVGALGLAAIVVAQLNRQDYVKGEVRDAEKMGGSYKISQDASDLITLNEKSPKQMEEEGKEKGNRMINLDKRRGGASDMLIHADYDTYKDISLRFQERVSPQEAFGYGSTLS